MVQLRSLFLLLFLAASFSGHSTNAESNADCSAKDKEAMATWFPHSKTTIPSTTLTSPTNCAFHVWSTQMFLWLTQTDPATGQPRVLSQYSLTDLFTPLGADNPRRAAGTVLKLTPKLAKSNTPDLDLVHQAGSAGVLVDQQNRSVYYSQHVNKTFYDFVRKRFFSQQPGGTFDPDLLASAVGSNDFFIPGAMELKVSWKIVEAGTEVSTNKKVFTIPAEIYGLKLVDGKIVVDTASTHPATVALVGMHVVGVVEDHPEFIWATFEHQDNAPDLPAGLTPGSNEPVSDTSWTFYAAKTPAGGSNQNPAGTLSLNEKTQALDPAVNVFRRFAFGTITGGPSASVNVANIQQINAFTARKLEPSDSVWKNYIEVGAIWMLPNTLKPDQFPSVELRGSTMLSNATMETYTQNEQQCFSCHNSLPSFKSFVGSELKLPGTNFNLSHILVQEYFRTRAAARGASVRTVR